MNLFRKRKTPKVSEEDMLRELLDSHAKAWLGIRFAPEANHVAAQTRSDMQRYVNDKEIDLSERKAVVENVKTFLDSFRINAQYTDEPVSAQDAELLRYIVVGLISKDKNAVLDGLNNIVQEVLTNSSLRMDQAERKAIVNALVACRTSCSRRMTRKKYSEAEETHIQGVIKGILMSIQGNVSGSRLLDQIQELNVELNGVISNDDIEIPTFSDYAGFNNTVQSALGAFQNKLRAIDIDIHGINESMANIRATYRNVPEGDDRRDSLSREYDRLKAELTTRKGTAKKLNEQMKNLSSLRGAIAYVSSFVDLTQETEFLALFNSTTYMNLLSPENFGSLMTMLKVYQDSYGEPVEIEPVIPTEEDVPEKVSALESDILAEDQKLQKEPTSLDQDVLSQTL